MTEAPIPHDEPANPVEEADLAVADELVQVAEHPLVRALGAASDMLDQEPLYAATGAFAMTGLLFRDRRTWQAGTEMLAAHLLATAMRGVVKRMVDRTRPEAAARRGHYEMSSGDRYESDFNSFPSGHTAGALAVALTAGRHFSPTMGPALGLAAAGGGAQVIRSRHYLTDVMAGAAIGWVAAALIGQLVGRAARF